MSSVATHEESQQHQVPSTSAAHNRRESHRPPQLNFISPRNLNLSPPFPSPIVELHNENLPPAMMMLINAERKGGASSSSPSPALSLKTGGRNLELISTVGGRLRRAKRAMMEEVKGIMYSQTAAAPMVVDAITAAEFTSADGKGKGKFGAGGNVVKSTTEKTGATRPVSASNKGAAGEGGSAKPTGKAGTKVGPTVASKKKAESDQGAERSTSPGAFNPVTDAESILMERLDLPSYSHLIAIEEGKTPLERWGPVLGRLAILFGCPVDSFLPISSSSSKQILSYSTSSFLHCSSIISPGKKKDDQIIVPAPGDGSISHSNGVDEAYFSTLSWKELMAFKKLQEQEEVKKNEKLSPASIIKNPQQSAVSSTKKEIQSPQQVKKGQQVSNASSPGAETTINKNEKNDCGVKKEEAEKQNLHHQPLSLREIQKIKTQLRIVDEMRNRREEEKNSGDVDNNHENKQGPQQYKSPQRQTQNVDIEEFVSTTTGVSASSANKESTHSPGRQTTTTTTVGKKIRECREKVKISVEQVIFYMPNLSKDEYALMEAGGCVELEKSAKILREFSVFTEVPVYNLVVDVDIGRGPNTPNVTKCRSW